MFKKLLNTIRSKVKGGSIDQQGNYYSPKDDEKLALRQTRMQQIQQANPTGMRGTETPNNRTKTLLYTGKVENPGFLKSLKGMTEKAKAAEKINPGSQVRIVPIPTAPFRPTITPTPTIPPNQQRLKEQLDRAFAKRGNPPLATTSAHMAQEGMRLQEAGLDPRMAFGIGIKESNGLKSGGQAKSNAYGIMGEDGKLKHFNTPNDATTYFTDLLLKSRYYEDYRKSKKPYDLLKRYTPVSDERNPAMVDQLNSLNQFLNSVR